MDRHHIHQTVTDAGDGKVHVLNTCTTCGRTNTGTYPARPTCYPADYIRRWVVPAGGTQDFTVAAAHCRTFYRRQGGTK